MAIQGPGTINLNRPQHLHQNSDIQSLLAGFGFKRAGDTIGRGMWGKVVPYRDHSGTLWAVKEYDPQEIAAARAEEKKLTGRQIMRREAIIPLDAGRYNVVPRLGTDRFIAMPHYKQNLEETLNEAIEPERVLSLTGNIATALDYVHNQMGTAHADLKPDNLLLDKLGNAHLTDFGLMTYASMSKQSDDPRDNMGYRYTRAPELFHKRSHANKQTDVWSLGAITYRLLTGEYPHQKALDETDMKAVNRLNRQQHDEKIEGQLAEVPKYLREFLRKSLAHNPEDRFQDAGEAKQYFEDTVMKEYQRSRPMNRLKRWGVNAFVGTALGLGIITLALSSTGKQLEEKLQEQSIELSDTRFDKITSEKYHVEDNMMSRIRLYDATRFDTDLQNSEDKGKLDRLTELFRDKETAYAYFVNPQLTILCMKDIDSDRWKDIRGVLAKRDGRIVEGLEDIASSDSEIDQNKYKIGRGLADLMFESDQRDYDEDPEFYDLLRTLYAQKDRSFHETAELHFKFLEKISERTGGDSLAKALENYKRDLDRMNAEIDAIESMKFETLATAERRLELYKEMDRITQEFQPNLTLMFKKSKNYRDIMHKLGEDQDQARKKDPSP